MTRRVLILAGMAHDGFQGDPVLRHFEQRTDAFARDVLGVADRSQLSELVRSVTDARFSPFAEVRASKAHGVCYSGAGHILHHEACLAGYTAEFAPLVEFFVWTGQCFEISELWRPAVDDVDVVALSTSFVLKPDTLIDMASRLKELGKIVVLGGVLVNKLPVTVLRGIPFDYCLRTEAETRFSVILEYIATGSGFAESDVLDRIPGLLRRREGRVVESPAAFEMIDFANTSILPTTKWVSERRGVHQYESVRGCPFRCEFCDYPFLLGNKSFRLKSADLIFKEWSALYDLGVRHIEALDSLFTVPKKRAARLAELLKESCLGQELTWSCYGRVRELADPAFVESLVDGGCRYIFLGVESGAQVILDNMRKLTTVEQNESAIRTCNEVGLYTSSGILVGFPGETEATVAETIEFLHRYASPSVHVFVWIPDFSEDSPVPIMQSDRRERFAIAGATGTATYPVKLWGERIQFELRTRWSHATMTQEQALEHAASISEAIRTGGIEAEDFSFAPYRSLLRHPSELAARMSFSAQHKFALGLQSLYKRFLEGQPAHRLRAEVPNWLAGCGLKVRDTSFGSLSAGTAQSWREVSP